MTPTSAARRVPSRLIDYLNSLHVPAPGARTGWLLPLVFTAGVAFAQQAPIAVNDGPFSVNEGGSLAGSPSVLTNDTEPDGQPLTVSVTSGPSFASSFNLNASTGVISYTHNGSETTADSFTYLACDNETPQQCDSAIASFTINPVNDPPIANPDSATVNEDSTNNPINVLANDTDPENNTLSVTSATAGNGTTSILGNGTVRYTPNPNFNGQDTINYSISDGNGGNASSTVTVTVNPLPDAPVANNDTATVNEDSTNNSINVTANDTDADGDTLTVTAASTATGTVSPSGGNVLYTPPPNFAGQATISYTISDGNGGSASATVTVTVTNVNDPPVANNDTATVNEDSTNNIINVTANDTDPDGNTLTVTIASTATGTASPSGGNVLYTPPANFTGQATISYTISDGNGGTASAIVTVTVTNLNDPPIANNDTATVNEDSTNNIINVTANDTDPDGDTLTVTVASAANGTATPSSGNVIYAPNANFNGTDTISYTISDGNGGSASATVTVTVTNVNDPPVANDDTATVNEDSTNNVINVTANDTDLDGDTLTVSAASAANGTATPSAGNVVYAPNANFNGTDTINYTVSDGNGGTDTAIVTVTVTAITDPPTAVNDQPPAIAEGGAINGTFNVLSNDTNPETTPLTAVLAAPPTNASAFQLNADGTFLYTHNGSETISDAFTYRANNGVNSDNVATVTITVTPVNDAPTIVGVQAPLTTPEDTPLTILVENLQIVDPDNTFPGDFTLVLQAGTNYTLLGNTLTPAANFNGQLTVPATVSDTGPLTSPVFNLTVTVSSENDFPSADVPIGPQTAVENSQFMLDVSGNFSDADGDSLTFSATGLPGNPTFGIDAATGVISGLPTIDDARDNDPYMVTVTATDPFGAFATDTFPLTVSALARANLALAIDVNSNTAAPAEDLRWTFSATNPVGPQAGQDVQLVGRFVGAGLTVTPNPGSNCTVQPEANMVTEFSCVLGALPVGATLSTVITTTTSQVSEVVAFATAAGANNLPIDPNADDNSAIEAAGVAEAFSVGAVQFLGATSIRSVTAGDLNGDGRADIVVGTTAGQPVQVYLGAAPRESCQCPRDFSPAPLAIQDLGANEGVALGDFDGNGSLDLVVANGGGSADRVYFNDGSGVFSLANSASLGNSFAQDVAVGDFNDDGRADIAIAAVGGNPVYLGNGAGGFSLTATLGTANSHDVAVADFNNDNRDDLVFANIAGPSQVWLSSAGGGFTAGSVLNIGDAKAVAAGELNGVGGPDLVFGRVPTDIGDIPSNPVILNDGTGGFGAPVQLLGFSPTNDVLIGETNSDGLRDLVFINASGVHQIWTSSGGSFVLHREQIIDGGARAGVLTDLGYTDNGNPGGNDLAMGGATLAGIGVYLNDGAGNLGRGDAVPPVLTLLGASSVSIDSGTAYSDAGATALDNIDGDITARIVRVSTVNTAVVGNYSVTYNVSDFAGNPATQIVRSVAVVPAVGTGGGGGGSLSVALLLALCGWLVVTESLRRHRNRGVMIKIRIREDNRDE